eukprot:10995402-Karenia_brevis.AAC.1
MASSESPVTESQPVDQQPVDVVGALPSIPEEGTLDQPGDAGTGTPVVEGRGGAPSSRGDDMPAG